MKMFELNPFLRFASALNYTTPHNRVQVADCRIFYVTEGNAQLTIGQKQYILNPNSLFYCCAGSRYTIETRDGFSLLCLNFDLTQNHSDQSATFAPSSEPGEWENMPVLRDWAEDSGFLNDHLFLADASVLHHAVERITQEFAGDGLYARELCSGELKSLIARMHRLYREHIPSKIGWVIRYIRQHHAQNITNRQLADMVGYHEYYLNRIFSASTGKSLHSFILQERLSRAAFLILNTDLELKEIAEQVGFGSYPHFSAYFKQFYCHSPAQYRKNFRNSI